MNAEMKRAMTIAGSDSGGGAGIQADLKTFAALGVFGTSAITALTAQNTENVLGIFPVSPEFVALQIDAVVKDIGTDAVKTGMLSNAGIIEAVAASIRKHGLAPLVVDPVMVAKSGDALLEPEARDALISKLLPLAAVVTPNLPEAEVLAGMAIPDLAAMRHATQALLTLGVPAVLLKGGHLSGETVVDLLATEDGVEEFPAPRIASRHTHGTGCTLASAIAAGLAQGVPLRDAVLRARGFVRAAILAAPRLGAGHGPLNHGV